MIYKINFKDKKANSANVYTQNYIVPIIQLNLSKPNGESIPNYAILEANNEEEALQEADKWFKSLVPTRI
jgi:hypothetical protein